jgi:multiple sugar transport system permease protein
MSVVRVRGPYAAEVERWGAYAVILTVAGFALFPIYWMVVTSLLPQDSIFRYPPSFLPPDAQLGGYRKVLGDSGLLGWIRNSTLVVAVSTVLSAAVAILGGYGLSRFQSHVGHALGYFLLASRLVPSTLWVIPLYLMYQSVGLLDTPLAVILAYTTFEIPFATWMLKGYFDSIPRELDQAAQIDGCSEFTALVWIILPVALPGIAASLMASAILGWSDYLFALTFLRDPSLWTVTVGIQSLFGEHVTLWNSIMAGSLLATLPMVILFLALGRYLVSGLTAGAVKQ